MLVKLTLPVVYSGFRVRRVPSPGVSVISTANLIDATPASDASRRLHPAATAAPALLDTASLASVADRYAAALDQHDLEGLAPPAGSRHYELLLRTAACEVWVIAWGAGSHLPLHDHGDSAGAFHVLEGELSEVHTRRRTGAPLVAGSLRSGSRRTMEPGDVHEVHNPGTEVAISVHAYSPPLEDMTFYGLVPTEAQADRPGLGGAER